MPDDEKDEEQEEGSAAPQPKRSGPLLSPFILKILMIFVGVIAVFVISIIAAMVVLNTAKPGAGGADAPNADGIKTTGVEHFEYLKFEDAFRQQLIDGRMIQLKIALGYKPKDKKLATELSQIQPELRDIVIKHLSRLKSEYFMQETALDNLQEDLLKQINRIINSGKIERIYFQVYTLM
jgi:flagellar basal body-associated protein FliL